MTLGYRQCLHPPQQESGDARRTDVLFAGDSEDRLDEFVSRSLLGDESVHSRFRALHDLRLVIAHPICHYTSRWERRCDQRHDLATSPGHSVEQHDMRRI